MLRLVQIAACVVLVVGCGEVRPPAAGRQALSPTYQGEIQALLARRCVSCHSGDAPAGSYDLSSYVGLLGAGSDTTRNAIAGDGTSRLLLKLTEDKHWTHLLSPAGELAPGESAEDRRMTDFAALKTWVLENRLAYFDVLVHPPAWVYPGDRNSEAFHGGALRASGWSYDACRSCHGQDLKGGTADRSCTSCHEGGPQACTTCHGSGARSGTASGAPPTDLSWRLASSAAGVGAHQAHLGKHAWWADVSCDDCHQVPKSVADPGHLFDDETQKTSDLRAELTFGTRAGLLGVTPAYDPKSGTCSVYCHGASFASIGQGSAPVWTSTGTAGCGSCHDVPARAGGPDCATCHQQSVTRCTPSASDAECLATGPGMGTKFLDRKLHGDGAYPLGKAGAEGTCHGCHGTQSSFGAPAPDLSGSSDTSKVTVGLHQVHLTKGSFAEAMPCSSCHQVPTSLTAKGHFEDDLPAEVTFSEQAQGKLHDPTGGLQPSWDRTSATCTNVFCHSLDGGTVTEWSWTKPGSSLSCTSCHGNPPAKTLKSGSHTTSTACQTCHTSAYDASGQLDLKRHINGKVDL